MVIPLTRRESALPTSFNLNLGAIIVSARLYGPLQTVPLRLLLDTGARFTVLQPVAVQRAGYSVGPHSPRIHIATVTGTELMPTLVVQALESLGIQVQPGRVVVHSLPGGLSFDGLLGLNFFRGRRLTIDFHNARIDLE